MEPSVTKTNSTPLNNNNNRRSSIESENSKKKSPRACAPCRKRKVKCNGQQPCDRCSKTDAACVYDKPQQKKDTPKPISENHEPRLKALEQFLKQFSNLLDTKDPEPPLFSNPNQIGTQHRVPQHRLSITTTGQGYYVPDKYLRTDRVPDLYKPGMSDWNPIIQELIPHSERSSIPAPPAAEPIRENLLSIYFQFVDPVIPILHKPSFLQQLRTRQPISNLLLNAIYCVSSRWDLAAPSIGEEPRGWAYYQMAVNLLDQQQEAKLSTVQALFLLLKYNEHVRRPGFIWRTRYYFQMIVRMCKDLGLPRDIVCTTSNMFIEIEKRKRTFWAVYCYDVMMSIENGTPPNFSTMRCSLDIPQVLPDEAQEPEKIMHFILLTKIMRNQSDIVEFLRRKYDKTYSDCWNEGGKSFEQLTNELKTTIGLITSTTKFPQKECMCYTVCFLYLASCFATILLHRPFAFIINQTMSPITMSHRSHCTEAALNIKIITELILECNVFEDMYCSIRGIQQIVHYLSAAVTVFKEGKFEQDLKITMQLTQRLASISPATEVVGRNNNNRSTQPPPLLPPPQSSTSAPPTITTTTDLSAPSTSMKQRHKKRVETALKRKSLHLPDMSQEDIVEELTLQSPKFNRSMPNNNIIPPSHPMNYSQQQQQQQSLLLHDLQVMNNNTNNYDYNNSIDSNNIPNHQHQHQSFIGLLYNNEDEK